MATLSTHTLNGQDGSHAGGIRITLTCISGQEMRIPVLSGETDTGGRFNASIEPANVDTSAIYELVLDTGSYWVPGPGNGSSNQTVNEVVMRFQMPDPDARYHIPFILSPNSYSVWWSQPEV